MTRFVKIGENCGSLAGQQARNQLAVCHNPVLVRAEESADNMMDCARWQQREKDVDGR